MLQPQDLRNVYQSWKSTISGILSAVIAIVLAVEALPDTWHARKPVIVLAVIRAIIGLIKKDAGQQEVTTPENPKPHVEASVETPVNPAATPVRMEVSGPQAGPKA